jgi:hypothetical protein
MDIIIYYFLRGNRRNIFLFWKVVKNREWLTAAGGTGRLLAGQRERDFNLGLPRLGLHWTEYGPMRNPCEK